jgi:hypothetical protein
MERRRFARPQHRCPGFVTWPAIDVRIADVEIRESDTAYEIGVTVLNRLRTEQFVDTMELTIATPCPPPAPTASLNYRVDSSFRGEVRTVPCPPELTALLRWHITEFGTGPGGRIFVGERNAGELPMGEPRVIGADRAGFDGERGAVRAACGAAGGLSSHRCPDGACCR